MLRAANRPAGLGLARGPALHERPGMTIPIDPRYLPPLPPELSFHRRFEGRNLRLLLLRGVLALFSGIAFLAVVLGKRSGELLFFLSIAVGGAILSWVSRRTRDGANRAREHLRAGRPDAALQSLLEVMPGTLESPPSRLLLELSHGYLRQGRFEEALSFGHEAARGTSPGMKGQRRWGLIPNDTDLRCLAPARVAALQALRGNDAAAQAWLAGIWRPVLNLDRTDYALLAQAVLLCRAGKYVEAVRRIQDTPREYVPDLDQELVALLHAFAREHLGGQLVPLKPGCTLPEKPARGSDYTGLARVWPELAGFLQGATSSAASGTVPPEEMLYGGSSSCA